MTKNHFLFRLFTEKSTKKDFFEKLLQKLLIFFVQYDMMLVTVRMPFRLRCGYIGIIQSSPLRSSARMLVVLRRAI